MEQPTQAELERLLIYEQVRMTGEANYIKNPNDAANLTKWGGALLEISQFGNAESSKLMLSEAVSKFEEVLLSNPRKHDTLWCLGNAFTNQGLLTPGIREAGIYFELARDCFKKSVMESPDNELYLKSLAAIDKAPELQRQIQMQGSAGGPAGGHAIEKAPELHRQIQMQGSAGGPAGGPAIEKGSEKSNSDWIYGICGWIILVGIFSWVAMAISNVPPPHPR